MHDDVILGLVEFDSRMQFLAIHSAHTMAISNIKLGNTNFGELLIYTDKNYLKRNTESPSAYNMAIAFGSRS